MAALDEDQLDKLEEFIFSNNLDDDAQEALWGCTPEIWVEVMKRGSLKGARDPTKALKQRINEAQSRQRPSTVTAKPHSDEPQQSSSDAPSSSGQYSADIEEFIAQHDFDEKAISVLRECDEQTQHVVLDRGPIHGARNMSAMLLSRIRDAKKAGPDHALAGKGQNSWKAERSSAYYQKPGQQDPWQKPAQQESWQGAQKGCDECEVEAFLAECDLDEKALEAMRSAAPNVQRIVIDRGPLSSARNPSGALMGRLRDAQAGKMNECPAHQRPTQQDRRQDSWQKPPSQDEVDGVELENFIADCDLDERATEAMRTAEPHVQRAVMDRGPLTGARNPSGLLMSRLRDAQNGKGTRQSGYSSSSQAPAQHDSCKGASKGKQDSYDFSQDAVAEDEIEYFLSGCDVDERAATALRTADPHVQRAVIDSGPLSSARNPSGALMVRMRDAQSGKGGKGPTQTPAGPRSAYGDGRLGVYGGGRDTYGGGSRDAYGGAYSAASREARGGGRMDANAAAGRDTYGLASRATYGGGSRGAYGGAQAQPCSRGEDTGYASNSASLSHTGSGAIPKVSWLSFDSVMSLVRDGMPDTAPMILYDKQQTIFQSASYIISDAVTDMSDVQIQHDEDWKQWPMVGEEYQRQTGEENCFALAISTEHNKWAAGFHAGKKGREAAAKLALAVAISAGTELEQKLCRNYPEFGALLNESGSTPAESAPASQGGVKRKAAAAFDAFSPRPAQAARPAPGAASSWAQPASVRAQSADQGYLL